MNSERLVRVLADLSREATGNVGAEGMLAKLGSLAGDAIEVDGVGMMITEEGANRFVHASDDVVVPLESMQALLQIGPCAAAVETGLPVVVEDLSVTDDWPSFCLLAKEIGVKSVLAVPLVAQGQTWGVLDLYRFTPGGFTAAEIDAAGIMADVSASYLVMAADREVARRASTQLVHQATHDPLTLLPNRVLLYERLDSAMATARRERGALAVVFIDLDHFKSINDNFGHAGGDSVLRQVAARLSATLGSHDLLGRLAGDEFVWITDGLQIGEPGQLAREVAAISARIRGSFDPEFTLDDAEVVMTASLGVIIGLGDTTAQELLAEADMAMYAAKRRGRGSVVTRDHTKIDGLSYARQLERDLARVTTGDQLAAHYQPIVDARSRETMVAVEVLLRWTHPDGPVLPAAAFIDVAVGTGLIGTFGRWMIDETCAQMRVWADSFGSAAPPVAYVNLSARELVDRSLAGVIDQALDKHGIAPHQLGLEILQEDLSDPSIALRLKHFRDRGHPLSIDDFGAGYSSLSRLVDLPVDLVKIHRTLIAGVPADRKRVGVIDAILTIADKLDLRVVAEGIETLEQADHLTRAGCDLLQGYFTGRPQPAEQLSARFSSGSPSTKPEQLDTAFAVDGQDVRQHLS